MELPEALRDTLRARVRGRLAHVVVRVPVADGEAIAALGGDIEPGEGFSFIPTSILLKISAPQLISETSW